jgi:hypothetical protein
MLESNFLEEGYLMLWRRKQPIQKRNLLYINRFNISAIFYSSQFFLFLSHTCLLSACIFLLGSFFLEILRDFGSITGDIVIQIGIPLDRFDPEAWSGIFEVI